MKTVTVYKDGGGDPVLKYEGKYYPFFAYVNIKAHAMKLAEGVAYLALDEGELSIVTLTFTGDRYVFP